MALCAVSGTVIGDNNNPVGSVTVKATLNAADPVIGSTDGVTQELILSKSSTTTTDASGYWSLSLIPNADVLRPRNTTYTFEFDLPSTAPSIQPYYAYANTVQAHGASFTYTVVVPAASAADFSTLVYPA